MGYRAIVHVTADSAGVSHPVYAHDAEGAKRGAWKWLDVVDAGGRVLVTDNGARLGCWIHRDGKDIWTE